MLPKLEFSMDSGVISEWLVPDGGNAVKGDPLYALEMDKAVHEVEAPCSGTLRIKAKPGQSYPVGTVIATIE